jgi:hypothetical protein
MQRPGGPLSPRVDPPPRFDLAMLALDPPAYVIRMERGERAERAERIDAEAPSRRRRRSYPRGPIGSTRTPGGERGPAPAPPAIAPWVLPPASRRRWRTRA